jgi:hypothetical protein
MQQAILLVVVFSKNVNDAGTTKLMVLNLYIVNAGCVSGERELK